MAKENIGYHWARLQSGKYSLKQLGHEDFKRSEQVMSVLKGMDERVF